MINEWIIGRQSVESAEHRKRVLLAGYFILTYLTTGMTWLVVSLFDAETDYTATKIGFVINLFCLVLVRKGWFYIGTTIFFIRSFAVTFYYSWLFPNTSSDIFFLLIGPAAIAIYGYEKRWIGLIWNIVGCMLFLVISMRAPEFVVGSSYFNRIVSFLLTYAALSLLVIFFNYITHQYDQRLTRQNSELIKTNQELDHFVHTASHDLKAPLNSISGLISIIKQTDDKQAVDSMFAMVENRVSAMKLFINDVVEHARNSRTEIQREQINLKLLVAEVHANILYDERANQIEFTNEIPDDLTCMSDRYRLRLVLSNIIYNGIKYSDRSKAGAYVKVSASSHPEAIKIAVSDNGIGIAREDISKLFKMFYRATTKESGTGIGLYIVKEAVEKLRGKIEVSSEIGQGTSFVITLPA